MTETISKFWEGPFEVPRRAQVDTEGGNLREFQLACRRQFWLVSLCALVGLALGVYHYATSPKQYASSAILLVEEKQTDLEQEIASLRPLIRNDTGFENQMQILKSRQLALDVVLALNLQDNPAFVSPPRSALGQWKADAKAWVKSFLPVPASPAATIGDAAPEASEALRLQRTAALLADQTQFSRVGRSYSVRVGFMSPDPELARDIANAYLDAYLADGMQANLAASDRTAEWMQDRIAEIRAETSMASKEAEAFRAEFGASDQQGLREREQRVDALNTLYTALEARYQELVLSASYPVSNGRILAPALLPDDAAKPVSWQVLLAGLLLGGLGGTGLAAMRELGETGFRTGADLADMNVALLGYLPRLRGKDRRASVGSPLRTLPESNILSLRETTEERPETDRGPLQLYLPVERAVLGPEVVVPDGDTPFARAALDVLSSIDLAVTSDGAKVIAVSGLADGDGSTTLTANLAHQAVISGCRTLVIDADFELHGLSNALSGPRLTDPQLDLARDIRCLPGGIDVLPVAEAEFTFAERIAMVREAVRAARTRYDAVLIDMPPAGHTTMRTLSQSFDGIVFVLNWGKTPRRSLRALLEREPSLRKRTVGAVLNRTKLGQLKSYGVAREELIRL